MSYIQPPAHIVAKKGKTNYKDKKKKEVELVLALIGFWSQPGTAIL